MPIEVKCPVCGKVTRFSEERAGRRNVCKFCGADVDVELPGAASRTGRRTSGTGSPRKTSRKGSQKSKSEGPSAALIGGAVFGVVLVGAVLVMVFFSGGSAPLPEAPAVTGGPQPPMSSGTPAATNPAASAIAYTVANWTAQPDPPRMPTAAPLANFRVVGLGERSPRTERVTYPATPSPFVLIGEGKGSADDTRELWDLSTGKMVHEFRSSEFPRSPIAISPDGRWIAWTVLGNDSGVRVIDAGTEKVVARATLPFKEMIIGKLAFASNERLVGLSNANSKVGIWNAPSGKRERILQLETGADIEASHALSPGGKYLACAHGRPDKGLTVYDLDQGTPAGVISQKEKKSDAVLSIAFSPDGNELAAVVGQSYGQEDARLLIWSMSGGTQVDDIPLAGTGTPIGERTQEGRHALQWFPSPGRLLVGGRFVVDRGVKRVALSLDRPVQGIDAGVSRRVLSNGTIASWETEQSPPAIVPLVVREEDVSRSIAVASGGGELSDARLPPLTPFARRRGTDWSKIDAAWRVAADPGPALDRPATPVTVDVGTSRVREIEVSRLDPARVCLRLAEGEDEIKAVMKPFLPDLVQVQRPNAKGGTETRIHWTFQPVPCRANSFVLFDPSQAAAISNFKIDYPCRLLAISPDGGRIAVSAIEGPGRLDIFATDGKHVCGCRPFTDDAKPELRAIERALFVDADTVVVTSAGERLAALRVPGCEPVYHVEDATAVALSSGGKLLASAIGKQIEFRDSLTGEGGGTVSVPGGGDVTLLSFSPSGDRLAALTSRSSHSLVIVDLRNGGTSSLPISNVQRPLTWVGPDRLLVGASPAGNEIGTGAAKDLVIRLVDLNQQAPVWSYVYGQKDRLSFSLDSGDRRLWVCGEANGSPETKLTALTIPDAALAKRLEGGEGSELESKVVLKAGMSVSVRLELPPAVELPDFADRVRKSVEETLGANGLKVGPDQPIVYVVKGEVENLPGTATMRTFGGGPGTSPMEITVQPRKLKVRLAYEQGSKTLWESRLDVQGGIGLIRFDSTKGAQFAIDEELWKSGASRIGGVVPPLRIFADSTGEGLGTSVLDGDGAFPRN